MGREITIDIRAKDHVSGTLKKISDASKHFSKDMDGMQAKLNALDKTKINLEVSTDQAKKKLADLKKRYEEAVEGGDQKQSKNLSKEINGRKQDYEKLCRTLGLVTQEAKNTEQAMIALNAEKSKEENRASFGQVAMSKEMLKLAGGALVNASSFAVKSVYGDDVGTIFSSALNGGISGASIGAGMGNPVAGAVVGTVVGLVDGATQVMAKADEAFKSVVEGQYNESKQKRANELASGIPLAAQREFDQYELDKILKKIPESAGGNSAEELLAVTKTMANQNPISYEDLASLTKTMVAYGTTNEKELKASLQVIGDTGAALGLSSADMNEVAAALGKMQSAETITIADLQPLLDRNIPVLEYLGTTIEELSSKGISGVEAKKTIETGMGEDNQGGMKMLGDTYSGLVATQQSLKQDLEASMGEGYTNSRKPALEEFNKKLDPTTETGESLQTAYQLMGEYQASLDNAQEKAWIDAIEGAMDSEEYKEAEKANDGAKMGEILTRAEADAKAQYHESDEYKLYEQSEKNKVKQLRIALVDDWKNYGYDMGVEFSLGHGAAINEKIEEMRKNGGGLKPSTKSYPLQGEYDPRPGGNDTTSVTTYSDAYGLTYVPYNDYPARLHEGEQVLTASQARAYRSGGGGNVTITGNEFIIREEADVGRIATELARRLREMQMVS